MDLSPARFERLVNLVYDTLDERDAWRGVLGCLCEGLGGRGSHLLAFDACTGIPTYSDSVHLGIAFAPSTGPRLADFDPGAVVAVPSHQRFVIPRDDRYVSACTLLDNRVTTVILACLRDPHDAPMPAEAIAFLDRLRPHLERACRMGLAPLAYPAQDLVRRALVDKLRQPVMLLTPGGEVVLVNDAARSLLDTTTLVKVTGGRLVLPLRYRDAFYGQCAQLEQSAATRREDGEPPFSALHLIGERGQTDDVLYGFFTVVAPERTGASAGMRPLIMLFFYHPTSVQTVDASLLASTFGLSHAECRVASLLADGMPVKSIAESLGIQYDTVRKHLLSIYQKTATNRQPELVRLLLQLPATAIRRELAAVAQLGVVQ